MADKAEQLEAWLTQITQRLLPAIFVVLGPAQSGKTTMIQAWKERYTPASLLPPDQHTLTVSHNKPPTAYLCSGIDGETPVQCARRLLEDLGYQPMSRSAHDLWQELGDILKANNIYLIIFDQAERLSLPVCQCIRSYLYDRAQRSIFFIGSPALRTTLQRDP
jgi:GTPase SAR1 family protein